MPTAPAPFASSPRLLSLDVFRGVTMAGMVLVNDPGSWEHIYWPLEHAQWSGWTPTDLVFPFFLFIVGVAITLSLGRRIETGAVTRDVYFKIIKRTLIIFAIGLFLNGIPQILISIGLLLFYCILVNCVPAPGYAAGDLTKDGSLPSYVDRVVFGPHVWRQAKVYDPEGLLSTIPALVTALIGVLAGAWLRGERSRIEKTAGMFVVGAVLVAIGWAWNPFFPINKALWTSSYVLFTGGLALQFLALCYWLIDIKGYRRWAKPFEIFGLNAIALYVLADLLANLFDLIPVGGDSLGGWIYNFFGGFLAPNNASLAFAITFVLICFFFIWLLYRRRIFIKI